VLSRSYVNIDIGLEPKASSYFSDRFLTDRDSALVLVENMRVVENDLAFFNSQNDMNDYSTDDILMN
jgi:hypothetical protein